MRREGEAATLRPLGVGEILDVAVRIYTRNLGTFITIVGIILIPIGLITILGYLSLIPEGAVIRNNQLYFPLGESTAAYNTFFWVTFALSLLATLLATGVGTRAVAEAYLGRKPSVGESYGFVGRRFHSLLWVSFLVLVFTLVAAIALIIPGIYVYVTLTVAVPVLVVEGLKGTKAAGRSYRLVQGRWWPTFGTILLGVALIPGVIQFAIGALVGAFTSADEPTSYLVLQQIGGTIGEVIAAPIQVAVVTVLYFDLRVRKEAFDVQLLTERLGSGPMPASELGPATPPPPPPGPGDPQPPSA